MAYRVPYVNVRVARSPMNIQCKQVLAHEVLVLMSIFPDTSVLGPVKEKGRLVSATVERDIEYERLGRLYGNKPESDTTRVEDVFGPPWGRAFQEALSAGLNLFDRVDESESPSVPEPPPAAPQSKPDRLVAAVRQMLAEDPSKQNEKWWKKDGAPELLELRSRVAGESVSDAERYQAYEIVQAEAAGQDARTINKEAVMAQLDDLDAPYDADADPIDLLNQLQDATVAGIKALGGEVDESASLEELSEQLQELRLAADG